MSKKKKKGGKEIGGAGKTTILAKPVERNDFRLFLLIILIAGVIVYAPSMKNTWTNWDDEGYVLDNPLVKSIDLPAIFSTNVMGNYHPVTVLVQAIEYGFFKENATGYHVVSLLFHLINALLACYFVFGLTRKSLPAFVTGLLLAIHPLHVESVSWISAQKDLLYTMFYLLALIFYLSYKEAANRNMRTYGIILLFFILSLLSKAQAVTLPVILLLVDWYQLQKINQRQLIEKIPLFLIAFIFGVVAIFAQQESESIQQITLYSWPERLMFSCYALVNYFSRLFIPVKLSAYYPYPEIKNHAFPVLVYVAPVIILLLGGSLFYFRRNAPLIFGILFFLVNIFLVLQLLPVGGAITADRYSYLSFTGLFFIIAVFFSQIWEKQLPALNALRTPAITAAVVWIVFLSYQAQARSKVWYSSETLWSDVISNYARVPIAYNDLGSYYQKHEQLDIAKKNFDMALKLQPDFPQALINRCDLYRVQNKIDSAIMDGNRAVKLKPGDPDTHMNRGIAFSMAEKNDSAMMDFNMVISLQPANARAYNNRGNLYMIKDVPDSAIINYNLALNYDPSFLDVLSNRGLAHLKKGDYTQAINDLSKSIERMPNAMNNYYFRMQAYEKNGQPAKALDDAEKATALGGQVPAEYIAKLQEQVHSR
jgi:tetratricopeptide (TPR) repeat protein